jgi:hypothetical protein
MFEGGEGNVLFEDLPDLVGEMDDLIEFAGGGGDVVRDVEGTGETEGAVDGLNFTVGGEWDRLVWGGSGIHP